MSLSPRISKFPVKFPVSREFAWRRAIQHCVASQAVRSLGKSPRMVGEMPANSRLFQFNGRSPPSRIRERRGEIDRSLRPQAEIFPFLGDGGRRPGSILTAWRPWQSYSRISLLILTEKRVSPSMHCRAERPSGDGCASRLFEPRATLC